MARSLKKGIYRDPKLEKKMKESKGQPIKTWARSAMITPEMIGMEFLVHNGKEFISVKIREEMVGHRLGEFSPTTKFQRHGGKMERELERKEETK
ncbi:MAG TPA: 30S ribosomal protein S19 [Candidatus Pacearchaeota archaeon]|nr:30S ribosomal protein S19 [Candidatus Pacearchaeota archaeon]HOK94043.1 30S ribosomal protein S19 [Candidatus Pacearchaeota archaeon]HPO75114.1 30S ribosomal protein S19 [Candidatus Pacearchaeota archaeon]